MKYFTLIVLTICGLAACTPKIYQSPDFDKVTRRHKLVAILPADVAIHLRPNQMKNLTSEQIKEQEENTGYEIQEAMYGWLLHRSMNYNYTVKFQDIAKTNTLLKEADLEYAEIKTKDRNTLAQLLGVDAVIQDITVMDKPMSDGAAIALVAILGTWGATNKVKTTINIYDGASSDLLWKYDFEASGSVGSSTDQLVRALMRNASRKFPYQAD